MCGILGWIRTDRSNIDNTVYYKGINDLFRLSETRGKEASGVCCISEGCVYVLKAPVRAGKLIASDRYKKCMKQLRAHKRVAVMGHSRMVTNGDASDQRNNQPVTKGDLFCIHNGIIVNAEQLWSELGSADRAAQVDTEVLLELLIKNNYKDDFADAFNKTLDCIEGSLSIALFDRSENRIFLYTNTGSLYYAVSRDGGDVVFSSEQYILERMLASNGLTGKYKIDQILPGNGFFVNISNCEISGLLDSDSVETSKDSLSEREVFEYSLPYRRVTTRRFTGHRDIKQISSLLKVDIEKIHKLKRCTKCLLPETFPGISFDKDGVCSICRDYKPLIPKGKNELIAELTKNRSVNSRYDCIAPISGGRDSCYILHYLVKELGLKPVTYTYDWGLVTDLARRNIQRMCASLGVEHILISADIGWKRENVRKNVEAWLRSPSLATVPLFMAGDKQFYYYAQLLKKQMKIDNVIFGMNRLEETRFKARFSGNGKERGEDDTFQHFSRGGKIRMVTRYGREFLSNPAYINSSLIDSFMGFLSYYALPQKYVRFFDYIPWDQATIENTLINTYDWETDPDSSDTWRIGDGTAPFYNYIYYRLCGFTEHDTFKSNQIREGMITREKALDSLEEANRVSARGFAWYCETVGIDPIAALNVINDQVPLYDKAN